RSAILSCSVALRGSRCPLCEPLLAYLPVTPMRIVAGTWRGRTLVAPQGTDTRPTADRVRQALFDMLLHAQWGGHDVLEGAHGLDLFAGTGAFGLEALSRGAAHATFVEH